MQNNISNNRVGAPIGSQINIQQMEKYTDKRVLAPFKTNRFILQITVHFLKHNTIHKSLHS